MKRMRFIVIRLPKRLAAIAVVLSALAVLAFAVLWHLYPFPVERLQKWDVSPVVLDAKGRPLLRLVGRDEQWRDPIGLNEMSPWLIQATIAVEDERFYRHPGVDPWAVLRALGQNITAGRIVSGASTLDMQLCRMMDDRPRTLAAKAVESFRALQLNRLMSKKQILELYLNVAPYGGNLRGVQAASLAYFNKHARDLSLPEAALLAGLPQSPSRYRPDRGLDLALKRQKVVLRRMAEEKMISQDVLAQAQRAPITISRFANNQTPSHAASLALSRRPGGGRTTIDSDIQRLVDSEVRDHLAFLPQESEVAVVVLDVAEAAIIAMLGSGDPSDPVDGQVNGALARRSPGSALKPFIYATAFELERLNQASTVYDIPASRGGWTPSNFDHTFSEEITVAEALRRSLNLPAILTAEATGLARCCGVLKAVGIALPPEAPRHGGLALAVGGVEVTLLDVTNAYATLARHGIHRRPRLFADEPSPPTRALKAQVCESINHILSCQERSPNTIDGFEPTTPWFMWKTGTSSGRRDAWAVGHNGKYAIGVWVGRFRGTGREAYVGAKAAEPLLAQLFALACLRNEIVPPQPELIHVKRPLALPREVDTSLRIISPSSGDVFVCYSGHAIVRASANSTEELRWFVNGQLMGSGETVRLTLSPGQYELRCLALSGRSTATTFTVVPSTPG